MKEMDGFVRTYQVFDGGTEYRIDIQMCDVDKPTERYEAWIYTPDVAIKYFMFGYTTDQFATIEGKFDEFVSLVEDTWKDYTALPMG